MDTQILERPWRATSTTETPGGSRTLVHELAELLQVSRGEVLGLRLRDVDLPRQCVFVPGGQPQGMSAELVERLRVQCAYAQRLYRMDMRAGLGGVRVPPWCDAALISALPQWYFVFPSPRVRQDPQGRWLREPMSVRMGRGAQGGRVPRPEGYRGRRQR